MKCSKDLVQFEDCPEQRSKCLNAKAPAFDNITLVGGGFTSVRGHNIAGLEQPGDVCPGWQRAERVSVHLKIPTRFAMFPALGKSSHRPFLAATLPTALVCASCSHRGLPVGLTCSLFFRFDSCNYRGRRVVHIRKRR
jgi:hypothetical protein